MPLIEFSFPDAAATLLANLIPDVSTRDSLLSHGCWCPQLSPDNNGNMKFFGGSPVDTIGPGLMSKTFSVVKNVKKSEIFTIKGTESCSKF